MIPAPDEADDHNELNASPLAAVVFAEAEFLAVKELAEAMDGREGPGGKAEEACDDWGVGTEVK